MRTLTEVPERFTDWLVREIPAGTVIGDPTWWAPYIYRAAIAAHEAEPDWRACLTAIMRAADSAKEPCGADPESSAAIRNGRLASIASMAAEGLGLIRGPGFAHEAGQAQPVAWRWKNEMGEWTYLDDEFCLKNRQAAGIQCFPLYENAQPINASARSIAAKLKKIITLPSDGIDADTIADAVAFLDRSADAYRQAALDCAAALDDATKGDVLRAQKWRELGNYPAANLCERTAEITRECANACRAIAERSAKENGNG